MLSFSRSGKTVPWYVIVPSKLSLDLHTPFQSFSGNTLTGGLGLHGSDFIPIFTDALFSQGSVLVDRGHLYVVNVSYIDDFAKVYV
jgi:hypothetical protein